MSWTSTKSSHSSGDGVGLLQRVETSTSPLSDTVASFESTLRYLRAQGTGDDLTLYEALQAAAIEAERRLNRTLRPTVTRTVYYRGFEYRIPIPYPPLQSVTSVKYYNVSDVLTAVSSSDYAVHASSDGPGWIEFQADYSFPTINSDRSDVVQVICVTGWADSASIPPHYKAFVRCVCEAIYDRSSFSAESASRFQGMFAYRGLP